MHHDPGDPSSTLDSLYREYRVRVTAQVRRLVRDEAACEDLVQETFFRAWEHRNDWREVRSFERWLARIATNLALNHLRARNRSRERLFVDFGEAGEVERSVLEKALTDFANPGPESQLAHASERSLVRRLIAELPDEKRMVLELVGQEDYSVRETSEALGIPDGTVKSRLHYGRRAIAEKLNSRQGEERTP
jgi:RNA polymerase sigma-70 factor, ECF subfamily